MLSKTLEPNERGVALYKDGKLLGYEDVVTISKEELAEEAEQKAMEKMEELIDNVFTGKQAIFMKRLCKRLSKSGSL